MEWCARNRSEILTSGRGRGTFRKEILMALGLGGNGDERRFAEGKLVRRDYLWAREGTRSSSGEGRRE